MAVQAVRDVLQDRVFRYKTMDEYRKLWDDIFADPDGFTDYYYRDIRTKNKIIDYRIDGRLVGMIHLNPYTAYLAGERELCYYIVGVAVSEDMRRKGIMRSMMKEAIDFMHSEGCPFTFLMPKKDEYYTGFGFEKVYRTSNIKISDIDKCDMSDTCNSLFDIDKCSIEELEQLASHINNRLSERYNYFLWRSADYLTEMIREHKCQNGSVMYLKTDGYECLFSYDVYAASMYVERFELLETLHGDEIADILRYIVSVAHEKGCKECIVTMQNEDAHKVTACVGDLKPDISEASGIMALSLDRDRIDVDNMKNTSFFDEIV